MKRVCAVVLVCVLAIPAFAAPRDQNDPARELIERLKKIVRIVKLLPQINADVLSVPKP